MTADERILFERTRNFLLHEPHFIATWVGIKYPLTLDMLRKYDDILDWYHVTQNDTMQWNTDIIDEFKHECFYWYSSEDDMHSVNWFVSNSALPWSVEFVERYEDLWDWQELADRNILEGELREHFLHRLLCCSNYDITAARAQDKTHETNEEIEICYESITNEMERHFLTMDKFPEYAIEFPHQIEVGKVDWDFLSSNEILSWTFELIDSYLDFWNWRRLSFNEALPWSEELIDRYLHRWDWGALSNNAKLPWSYAFLKKYDHLIDWSMEIEEEDGCLSIPNDSINNNLNIPWDGQMIEAFHHKIVPWITLGSAHINWTLDLIVLVNTYWPNNLFIFYPNVWENVFYQFSNPENFIPLLDDILVKERNGDYK